MMNEKRSTEDSQECEDHEAWLMSHDEEPENHFVTIEVYGQPVTYAAHGTRAEVSAKAKAYAEARPMHLFGFKI